MNTDIIQGEWTELKGKIKAKWGKLTDNEIDTLEGNIDQIKGKIQKTYGHSVDQAEKEFNEFKQSVGKKMEAVNPAKSRLPN